MLLVLLYFVGVRGSRDDGRFDVELERSVAEEEGFGFRRDRSVVAVLVPLELCMEVMVG